MKGLSYDVRLDEDDNDSSDRSKSMSTAPLNRETQIRFMTEASTRHTAIVDRWMKDDEIRCMLSLRVDVTEESELSDADEYLKVRHA